MAAKQRSDKCCGLHTEVCIVSAERQLRKQVEAELGVDLTDRKAIIRAEVQLPLHGHTQD